MRSATCVLLALATALGAKSCGEVDAQSTSAEAEAPARVEITNEGVYDAGTLEITESIDHTFLLTNTGSRPVELGHVWKACNCTELEVDKDRLEPGESAAVHAVVRFNSEDFGPRTIRAAIYESETSPEPLAQITLFARVGKPAVLNFSPSTVDFGELEPDQAAELRVTLDVVDLVGSGGCVPELIGFDVEGPFEAALDATPEWSELKGHPLRRYAVVVRARPGVGGARRATLTARMIVGDVELVDRLTVEGRERPWVRLERPELFTGHVAQGKRHEFEIAAETLAHESAGEIRCRSSADWIEASWSEGDAASLRLALTPPAPGRLDERVVLAWGDRQIEVPLRGWVD